MSPHNVIGEAAARKTPIQFGGLSPSPRPACSVIGFLLDSRSK